MSGMITFLDTSAMNTCKKAVAPVIVQADVTFDAVVGPTGAAPEIVVDIAAGSPAAYGGQVVLKGCLDALVTMNYLAGDDCSPCTTPDTLTLVPVTLKVPANSSFPLPEGFWQDLSITLIDATGAPVALTGTLTEDAWVYSCYTPECPDCAVLAI